MNQQYKQEIDEKNLILAQSLAQLESKNSELANSLTEKEVLLKEVHHRVKNNLQVIYSMHNLQLEKVEHPEAIKQIEESKSRIMSMALVHQKLYAGTSISVLSAKDYIEDLVLKIDAIYAGSNFSPNLVFNIDDIVLDLDQAIPIGLIVNELVSNAYKYAFKQGHKNSLDVQLNQQNQQLELVIKDSGELENLEALKNSNTLGLFLVKTLVKQLEGTIDFQSNNGLQIAIIIKNI